MSTSQNNSMSCRSLAELKIRSRILLKAANQKKPEALSVLNRAGSPEAPFKHKRMA